ncbi:MAG: AAA-like domain-containing protein [Lachnospiraceae bacterium]|nr:AAA-like domain-containing protein [Lachnospiraceae bacterium]
MKQFNTTAVCIPSKHYMVDLSERVKEIKGLVDAGKYFTINRARQYGKTTTLNALKKRLEPDYEVLSLDFQGLGNASFETEEAFCRGFTGLILNKFEYGLIRIPDEIVGQLNSFKSNRENNKFEDLMRVLRRWCSRSDRPIVVFIDEVDSATYNQVFLDFLAQLRDGYISRDTEGIPTFLSVILAGVTDVKHLRSKIRFEEVSKENSPWNIAADFTIDMSLSETGIKGMLDEYEADHHTGMNTEAIAKSIREYTNGYPFLVSRICQLIDEEVCKIMAPVEAWTDTGIDEAVKLLLAENNTLFQSLTKNLNNYPELKAAIRSILMEGIKLTWNPDNREIVQMEMYGLIRNDHNTVRIANRIFETMLYNLFLSDEELKNNIFIREGELAKNIFIEDGRLNMRLIMEHFIETYTEVCGPLKERFREKDGREQFLLYLKPIINGTGNYYIEAQTRDQTRTDVIVDYLEQQYIIELKIWRGERYNAAGEKQISEYLAYWHLSTGYMLSFNFNKDKRQGVHPVYVGDKLLYEGTV